MMKENAIIVKGERFDFIEAQKADEDWLCKRCEASHICPHELHCNLCDIYDSKGYFRLTKSVAELSQSLLGKFLYKGGKNMGSITCVGRDIATKEPYIYWLQASDNRYDFYYSDLVKMMRGGKFIYKGNDSFNHKTIYELKGGDE